MALILVPNCDQVKYQSIKDSFFHLAIFTTILDNIIILALYWCRS